MDWVNVSRILVRRGQDISIYLEKGEYIIRPNYDLRKKIGHIKYHGPTSFNPMSFWVVHFRKRENWRYYSRVFPSCEGIYRYFRGIEHLYNHHRRLKAQAKYHAYAG